MTSSAQAGWAERLQISEREWAIVAEILEKYLAGKTVWAFGSRATGKHVKRFSDLDLAVPGRLTWEERTVVSEAFDESLLSFKVDVVELELVDSDFRQRIEKDFVLLQRGAEVAETADRAV
jgi:predicted nucleotidyltransferase